MKKYEETLDRAVFTNWIEVSQEKDKHLKDASFYSLVYFLKRIRKQVNL